MTLLNQMLVPLLHHVQNQVIAFFYHFSDSREECIVGFMVQIMLTNQQQKKQKTKQTKKTQNSKKLRNSPAMLIVNHVSHSRFA